jgi:hypothetical protein
VDATWPDPTVPHQAHLDVRVSDVDEAERGVPALGARRVGPDEDDRGFRVQFTDECRD